MICSGVMVSITTCHAGGPGFYSQEEQVSFSIEMLYENHFNGKRNLLFLGLVSRNSCMAGWNANHYTRVDHINVREILNISI